MQISTVLINVNEIMTTNLKEYFTWDPNWFAVYFQWNAVLCFNDGDLHDNKIFLILFGV